MNSYSASVFHLANIERNVNAPVFDATGNPLDGPNFLAELWGGGTPDSLVPAMDQFGGGRLFAPFDASGYFQDGDAHVPSATADYYSWLQVRAWDARLGATYEEVAALDTGGYGESSIFYAQGRRDNDMLGISAPLIGLQSFSLRQVPEPSAWALLILGGVILCWAARRKRSPRALVDMASLHCFSPMAEIRPKSYQSCRAT